MAIRRPLVLAADGTVTELPAGDTLPADSVPAGGGTDPWTWARLTAAASSSAVTFSATPLTFTAAANTTYLVQLVGAYQSAATTTGLAVALDIPSGSVIGLTQVAVSATAGGVAEQIADATTTGATTGVRAAATNTPVTASWVLATGATGGTVTLTLRSEVAGSAVTLQPALTVLGARAIP